jgi:methylmalonyl-CoA mutase cobalamin-binding subunit
VSRFNFFVVLLGDEPALEPRVAFYQRLAARDQDEAADVAIEEANRTTPEEAFDTVIIPALGLARRDHEEGDLDAAAMKFVISAAREVAVEVADLREAPVERVEERVRVLLCPARDEAEQVATDLLAMTLDANRWEVKVSGDDTLASELIEQVAEFQPAVVVIASMPPGGLSHVRYLLTRLRQRFPDVKLLVGRWGGEEGVPEAREDAIKYTDGVDRTLADTRKRLSELHSLLLTAEKKTIGERTNKMKLIGTAGA